MKSREMFYQALICPIHVAVRHRHSLKGIINKLVTDRSVPLFRFKELTITLQHSIEYF